MLHKINCLRIQTTSCFYFQGEELNGDTDIPIFTDQFLQHNKLRESELKQLRKANSDYEQQVIKYPKTFHEYVVAISTFCMSLMC